MFSNCANPECGAPFDYHQGRFFRFHKNHPDGQAPENTHSVQHFWLCATCARAYTLEYRDGIGVLITNQLQPQRKHLIARP
jgi:hypothetical protein